MNKNNTPTYRNPFDDAPKGPLYQPRNYSDSFKPEEYESMSSIDMEAYARNLHNYLMTLLQQEPFPAFLFEKLEKRLDGLTSLLKKRSAASGALNKDKAKERIIALGKQLDQASPAPVPMEDTDEPLPKRRRIDPPGYVKELVKENNALKDLKRSYGDSTQPVEEEEEEDQH